MTASAFKENNENFEAAMREAYSLKGAYFIIHMAANLLEDEALVNERDRNGFKLTPARRKEMTEEAQRIRELARAIKN
jgi:hypothetical protein